MFKDIKEFSNEESKNQPSTIIEEENLDDSGYNDNDNYNKLDVKIKKVAD